jgi:hypothetical protein
MDHGDRVHYGAPSTQKNWECHRTKWRRFLSKRSDLHSGEVSEENPIDFSVLEAFAAMMLYDDHMTSAGNYLSTVWLDCMRDSAIVGRNLEWKYTDLRSRLKNATSGREPRKAKPITELTLLAVREEGRRRLFSLLMATGLRPVAYEEAAWLGSVEVGGATVRLRMQTGGDKLGEVARREILVFCACCSRHGATLCPVHNPVALPVSRRTIAESCKWHGHSGYCFRRALIMGLNGWAASEGRAARAVFAKERLNAHFGWTSPHWGSYDSYCRGALGLAELVLNRRLARWLAGAPLRGLAAP